LLFFPLLFGDKKEQKPLGLQNFGRQLNFFKKPVYAGFFIANFNGYDKIKP